MDDPQIPPLQLPGTEHGRSIANAADQIAESLHFISTSLARIAFSLEREAVFDAARYGDRARWRCCTACNTRYRPWPNANADSGWSCPVCGAESEEP